MGAVTARDLTYSYEGVEMCGRFYVPTGLGQRPGILMIHGAHGLGEFIKTAAERLSAEGYAVLAVDLWGGRELLTDPSSIGPRLGAFASDRAMWMGRVEAARAALVTQSEVDGAKVGILGYCFGGSTALEFARIGGAIKGAVSFHGGLDIVLDDWGPQSRGKVLMCSGGADPLAKPEDLARLQLAMSHAGIDWETDVYGNTRHAFTEPNRPNQPPFAAYDLRADRRSWAAMTGFFAEIFA